MKKLIDICGKTPLIKISESVYGKLETYSPSGSVKDRMVLYVTKKALDRGEISEGFTLCDATSGNTGISLSMTAASLGLKCVIFMPENMSEERKRMMRIYGAEIVYAPADDFETAISMRDDFLSRNPTSWSPRQFSNLDNIACHQTLTAPEILQDVSGLGKEWGCFVHGSGTGGTIEGVRRFIKENKMSTKVVMVQPSDNPHGIQGIADGKDFLAKQSDFEEIVRVSTADAIKTAKSFAASTGVLIGISAGANIAAAKLWASRNKDSSGLTVTMLCDRGERYMSLYD